MVQCGYRCIARRDRSAFATPRSVFKDRTTRGSASTNVVVNDHMTVVEGLLIDGQSFTLNGSITLSNKYYINTHGDAVLVSLD